MAFPGTFNINYYEGDSYEFKVYPKNSVGGVFNLAGYAVQFFIATARGSSATQYECQAEISSDSTVTCLIPPGVGRQLTAGTSYVYDVEVRNSSTGKVYTVLTGSVSVTADVSGAI